MPDYRYTKQTFLEGIRTKYPQYDNMDDKTLYDSVIKKYPVYQNQINPLPQEQELDLEVVKTASDFSALQDTLASTVVESTRGEPQKQLDDTRRNVIGSFVNEAFAKPFYSFLAGSSAATGGFLGALDQYAKWMEEKAGIPRGGLFEDLSKIYLKNEEIYRKKGIQPGQGIAGDIAKTLSEGTGQLAITLPSIMALGQYGLPIYSGAMGGAEAISKDEGVLGGIAKGAIKGMALKTVLGGTRYLPRGLGEATGAGIFGGLSLQEEMQKPEGEINWSSVFANALLGAALTIRGKRISNKEFFKDVSENLSGDKSLLGKTARAKLNRENIESIKEVFKGRGVAVTPKIERWVKTLPDNVSIRQIILTGKVPTNIKGKIKYSWNKAMGHPERLPEAIPQKGYLKSIFPKDVRPAEKIPLQEPVKTPVVPTEKPAIERKPIVKGKVPVAPKTSLEINQMAIGKYGETFVNESIGYITREGKNIDSSGIRLGSSGQGRNIDHREIAQHALGEKSKTSGTKAMREFMDKTGDVRVVNTSADEISIDIPIQKGLPSQKQLNIIQNLSKNKNIFYDFTDAEGNVIKAGEGQYNVFIRDLENTVRTEIEIKAEVSEGKIPSQLKPIVDFITKNNLTKDEFIDTRFNENNPLFKENRKAMDKSGVGVNKTWSDFGFKSNLDFYDRVIKEYPDLAKAEIPEAVKPEAIAQKPEVTTEIPEVKIKLESEKATEMQSVFEKQRAEIEDYRKGKRITPSKVYRFLKRKLIDTSGNIKKKLDKTESGKKVIIKHDLTRGASAKSALEYGQIYNEIFKGLSTSEKGLLGNFRQAKRSIEVEELGRDIKSPGTKEQNKAWLDELKKQNPKLYEKIESSSKKIDEKFREYLDFRKEEGLLTDEAYEAIQGQVRYNPRKFLKHIDDEITYEFAGKKITVTNSGIKSLDKGSETALVNDPELLLAEYISRTNGIVARNRAAKQLYKYTKETPDNEFIEIAKTTKKGFKKTPHGKTAISAMIDGREHRMWMTNDMAKEWVVRDPEITQGLAQAVRWLSGSAILKPMATGLNPEFAVANVPRDIAHILFTTDSYSTFLPLATGQMLADVTTVAKDAFSRKGRYIDYIKEGGGMEFLTHQGRVTKHRLTGNRTVDNIQKVLGYTGETSEILTRLALRERAIKNGKSSEEATWIARNYLDFAQGGSWAKAADTGIPYLNAGIQASRGIIRGAVKHPYKFTAKVAQVGALAVGLYYANRNYNPEAWEEISEGAKTRNWIITTPWSTLNEDGTKKYYYFAIPKDQGQRIFAGAFEAIAERKETGKLPTEKLMSEFKDFFPYIPTESLSPTMGALIAYSQNRDFWTGKDIWVGQDVLPKEEYYTNTPKAWIGIGKKTGVSPVKAQRAAQKIFTYRNIYTDMVGGAWKVITKEMPEKEVLKLNTEFLKSAPFIRRILKSTYKVKSGEIKRLEIEENTRKLIQNRELQNLYKQYNKKEIKLSAILKHISKQPITDRDRLKSRLRRMKSYKVVNSWWLDLAEIDSPEVRAVVFYTKWKDADKKERQQMISTTNKIKGISSKKFLYLFNKLKHTDAP